MRALHVRLEGFTAAYPYPFLKSGTQLTMPAPPFSSIMGNIGACAGRPVLPDEMLVGFEFESAGKGIDLERTQRLRTEKKYGRLSENPERGIAKRQFHVRPCLDIYLSDVALASAFLSPVATPCLGRSQDIAWISRVSEVELEARQQGELGHLLSHRSGYRRGTLVCFPNTQVGGMILPPLADYYLNGDQGRVRVAGRYSRYQYVPAGSPVSAAPGFDLFHPSDSSHPEHVIVLHRLTA